MKDLHIREEDKSMNQIEGREVIRDSYNRKWYEFIFENEQIFIFSYIRERFLKGDERLRL